jgi:surfactin synthase thioesterase subunit
VPDPDDALAVVGLAARLPGARDIEEFWLNLLRGRTSVSTRAEGDGFAAELFGVPPYDAAKYDQRTRLFLQVAHAAIENAGYDPGRLAHRVGVFVPAYAPPGALRPLLPNAQPQACPSALAGLHLACRWLRAGAGDVALVIDGACAALVRRLPDARADHDHIYALIRSTADAVPEDIRYVAAADGGLAGFVTAVLALEREHLPPAGFTAWPRDPARPRRAAVGPSTVYDDEIAAYLVLEEAPVPGYDLPTRQPRVVVWSARTVADERAVRQRLAQFFVWRGEEVYADAVATLQYARARHPVRAAAVCTSALDAAAVLGGVDGGAVLGGVDGGAVLGGVDGGAVLGGVDGGVDGGAVLGGVDGGAVPGGVEGGVLGGRPVGTPRPVYLLFPGDGTGYLGLVRQLYRALPAFAYAMDGWFKRLDIQHPPVGESTGDESVLGEPLLFAVEVALAQLWLDAGVRPAGLLGDGIGELAAAAVAGCLQPEDAAALVLARSRGDDDPALSGVPVKPPTVPVYSAASEPIDALLANGEGVLLEVGPGRALTALAHRYPGVRSGQYQAVPTGGDVVSLLTAAARLWTEGHEIGWEQLGQPPLRRRVPLPAYPYQDAPIEGPACAVAVARTGQHATRDWFEVMTPDAPGPMVVAMPYAGGSSRAFRSLRQYLPPECGLALVDLPGHGFRMGEPCLSDPDVVVAELFDALPDLPAKRLILLGYSLGGSFGYELAARLTDAGRPPDGLVVCGTRAPQTGVGHPPVAHLPAGEPFLRAAVDLSLAAPEMLELPVLADSFAGPLQADLSMVESFRYRPRPPLDLPVCVVGFRQDWLVPEPSLRAWDAVCRHPPLHLRIDGGHLAVHEREVEFGEAVRTGVAYVIGRCLSKEDVR